MRDSPHRKQFITSGGLKATLERDDEAMQNTGRYSLVIRDDHRSDRLHQVRINLLIFLNITHSTDINYWHNRDVFYIVPKSVNTL